MKPIAVWQLGTRGGRTEANCCREWWRNCGVGEFELGVPATFAVDLGRLNRFRVAVMRRMGKPSAAMGLCRRTRRGSLAVLAVWLAVEFDGQDGVIVVGNRKSRKSNLCFWLADLGFSKLAGLFVARGTYKTLLHSSGTLCLIE